MKNKIIDNINSDIILKIMSNYGIKGKSGKDKTIWFKTICHNGKKEKLCYYEESKSFYCFTECGAMSIFDLIMKLDNCDYSQAIHKLAYILNINHRQGLTFNSEIDDKINKYIDIKNKKKIICEIEKKIDCEYELNHFDKNTFYKAWVEEGITINTLKKYSILWCELDKEIIIPHNNELGEIVGIRRRSLNEGESKYMPLTFYGETKKYSHSLNKNFYGLDKNIEYIKKVKKVCIVEGEKSVLKSDSYYNEKSYTLGTCGFNISQWHINKLIELGVEEVLLCFDKDYDILEYEDNPTGFDRFIDRLLSLSRKLSPYFKTYVVQDRFGKLDLKDSPFDKGKEILEFLIQNKIEIGMWEE